MPVQIGFFRDFKSSDTLLIEGDSSGLRQLADVCGDLAEDGGSTAIHELPFVEVHHGIRVVASTADRGVGGPSRAQWRIERFAFASGIDPGLVHQPFPTTLNRL